MRQSIRTALISKISIEQEGKHLGKTAMMKLLFILERVYKVPLDYDFSIYTYGPYCADVMADIDMAFSQKAISVVREHYQPSIVGYNITPSEKAAFFISQEKDFLDRYKKEINEVLDFFGDKNARELELYSTIIYVYGTFSENAWPIEIDEVCKNVHVIKPHFSIETIKEAYCNIETKGLWDRISQ